ncbi:hypothetical protein [Lyngbya confervoides]|uniref:Uncharacterized protein n=1 Tax=Lyngbya confervoides BDU141951 TaxID=1574623 RepID=A0ABD4T414_9CYAN|nr:hypothetical protein [Lyngbya confervoides]MCM1983188.1 hypothetical protein [Lyngbya confervoides BDU141951]
MAVRKSAASESSEVHAQTESKAPARETDAKKDRKSNTGEVVLYEQGRMVSYAPEPLPANRPIYPSNSALVPSESLPNGRPILAGSAQVASLDHLPHHRPVLRSQLDIVAMHGDRPVVSLHLPLKPSDSLPNNRPIATAPLLEEYNLMGFLD